MRLFLYYSFHSVKNQLKKMLKTWVMVFLVVCLLIGFLVGFVVSKLDEKSEDTLPDMPDASVELVSEDTDGLSGLLNINEHNKTELIIGGLAAAMLFFYLMKADEGGSSLFQPADVPLLFASPMKPQAVLFFRLGTQLCLSIFISIYFAFTTFLNFTKEMEGPLIAMFVITFLFIMFIPVVFRVLFYLMCSRHPGLRKYYNKVIYGVLLVIIAVWAAYMKNGNFTVTEALVNFFNAPVSRYVPVWGWTKGMFMYAYEGNFLGSLLCTAANTVMCAVTLFAIWHMKVDFYEEAMIKSDEMAERILAAQSSSESTVLLKRKKDRSDRFLRDGMKHGNGANIFFFKAMYNRFRFAHFHVFTKTMESYAFFSIGAALVCRLAFGIDDIMYVAFVLGVLSFYRAMGNPMVADVNSMYFRLMPDSTWKKLFFSLAGGSLSCFIDVIIPLIVAALILGTNPLLAFPWAFLVVSIDFFSTCAGTFIGVSTPQNAGKQLKSIVLVMFLYFGMIPDVIIIMIGFFTHTQIFAAFICGLVNAGLGFAFYAFTPFFIGPFGGK